MTGNFVRHLADDVLLLAFRFTGRKVQQQLTSRAVWLAEVLLPAQGAQILRPKRQGKQDVDGDGNLGFNESKAASFQILCGLGQQPIGKKQELGTNLVRLEL